AGPVPTITASTSGTPAHFFIGVAARLHVAWEFDRPPPEQIPIAAVLGRAVRALAHLLVHQRAQLALLAEPRVLLVAADVAKVTSERGEAFAIDLLPSPYRPVELAFGDAARSFDARAPRQLLMRRERDECVERRVAAEASAERAAGEDARRCHLERAEQAVDVVGNAER